MASRLKDRKGAPRHFDPVIAATMIETGNNLEVTGIRVDKYYPDFLIPADCVLFQQSETH
jgi:hypothetical protein